MSTTVFTGWRTVTPGKCVQCGCSDDWDCDGRGNILCSCQACVECGSLEASLGWHEQGCPAIESKVSPAVRKLVRERSKEHGWDPEFIERLISGQEEP